MAGQELNRKIQEYFGVANENARKILQRAVKREGIHTSAPVTFGKGQYLYYLGRLNEGMVLAISREYRPAMYRLLKTLLVNDGIMSYYEGLKITACPIDPTKTKMDSLTNLINDLKELKLVKGIVTHEGMDYILHSNVSEGMELLIVEHMAKMYSDCVFIPDILSWLQKTNLISNKVSYRNKNLLTLGVNHNNFTWDVVTYTTTTGIANSSGNSNVADKNETLVVMDILISRMYNDEDLQGFYNRVQGVICSSKTRIRKILPIIVVQEMSEDVIRKSTKLGFLIFNIKSVFGERISYVIENLKYIKIIQLLGSVRDSEEFYQRVEKSLAAAKDSGHDVNLENIKGDFFEALIYPLFAKLYPNCIIRQNRIYKEVNEGVQSSRECDYIIVNDSTNENLVFELKGYKSNNTINLGNADKKYTVRWFFRNVLHFVEKHIGKEFGTRELKGCYMTSARFSPEALEVLETINKSRMKPDKLDVYYDGPKLYRLLQDYGLKHAADMIDRYYFEKPLSE